MNGWEIVQQWKDIPLLSIVTIVKSVGKAVLLNQLVPDVVPIKATTRMITINVIVRNAK
jgi:hypothetical protein